MERLTPADADLLDLEDRISAMHNVSVAIFRGPEPPFAELEARVAERIPTVPRLRQRVVPVPFDIGRPLWIDDPYFSLDYHVRHTGLPTKASMADLRNLVGRVQSQRLDRGKPLWELWMVSGLPRRQWAIISKAHYSMVDGVSGADPLSLLVDQAKARRMPDFRLAEEQPSDGALVARSLVDLAFDPAEQFRIVRRRVLEPLLDPMGLSRRRHVEESHAGLVGPIGPHRRWREVEVEAEAIRSVRDRLGVATNDVVLGLVTWGIRCMLLAHDREVPDAIRTLAPLAVATGDHFANEINALEADLPLGLGSLPEMVANISEQTADVVDGHKAVAGSTLAGIRGLVAPTLCALGLRSAAQTGSSLDHVQTVTVNAPGPRETVTVLGKAMAVLFPAIPLVVRSRLAVGVMSYEDHFGFGLTADRDAELDLDALANGLASALVAAA